MFPSFIFDKNKKFNSFKHKIITGLSQKNESKLRHNSLMNRVYFLTSNKVWNVKKNLENR